jgi:hypothetical protein
MRNGGLKKGTTRNAKEVLPIIQLDMLAPGDQGMEQMESDLIISKGRTEVYYSYRGSL